MVLMWLEFGNTASVWRYGQKRASCAAHRCLHMWSELHLGQWWQANHSSANLALCWANVAQLSGKGEPRVVYAACPIVGFKYKNNIFVVMSHI